MRDTGEFVNVSTHHLEVLVEAVGNYPVGAQEEYLADWSDEALLELEYRTDLLLVLRAEARKRNPTTERKGK